ncbi:HNH endonuclease family protein [Streptomonospora alba]|uniref:HNH endonuclease family protein n=1 Tax=Streptomonospora alba TaxID=183763 RepID=UPI001EE720DC|nr:HNH endonuclease family protein [Streptomonospora alba]
MVRTPGTGSRFSALPRPARRAAGAVGAALAVALVAGCGLLPWSDVGTRGPSGAPSAPPAEGPTVPESGPAAPPGAERIEQAESRLQDAEVAPESSGADYERDEFGSSWIDTDGNGCPTRHDVLARDLRRVRVADDCTVTRGVLEDPYTGERVEFSADDPMEVQIDHVVPLALAWRTGASEWDRDTREEFGNDPGNLIAADGPANQAKGDSGPGEWQPYPPFRCTYAVAYVGVVDEYGLRLPPDDHAALEETLAAC